MDFVIGLDLDTNQRDAIRACYGGPLTNPGNSDLTWSMESFSFIPALMMLVIIPRTSVMATRQEAW